MPWSRSSFDRLAVLWLAVYGWWSLKLSEICCPITRWKLLSMYSDRVAEPILQRAWGRFIDRCNSVSELCMLATVISSPSKTHAIALIVSAKVFNQDSWWPMPSTNTSSVAIPRLPQINQARTEARRKLSIKNIIQHKRCRTALNHPWHQELLKR